MKNNDIQNIKIKQFFAKNNIKYVLFDMDSTLVDTTPYFTKKMSKAILKIIKIFLEKKSDRKQITILNEIRALSTEIY